MSNLSTHIPFVKQNDESYFEAGTLGLYVDNDGNLMCGPKGMSTSLVEGLRLGWEDTDSLILRIDPINDMNNVCGSFYRKGKKSLRF